MKRKRQNPPTDHHIVPSSRGGLSNDANIKRVPEKQHQAFHLVFANLTPAEIYEYLDECWFNPKCSFIKPEQWLAERDEN